MRDKRHSRVEDQELIVTKQFGNFLIERRKYFHGADSEFVVEIRRSNFSLPQRRLTPV
jgi:hypothetical protein